MTDPHSSAEATESASVGCTFLIFAFILVFFAGLCIGNIVLK